MNSETISQKMFLLAFLIIGIVFFIFQHSFQENLPTCEGYISNVYLYLLLGLLIVFFFLLFIKKRNYPLTKKKSFLSFLLAFIFLISITFGSQGVFLNHLLWLGFLISIAVGSYRIWNNALYQGTLNSTLINILLLMGGLTVIVFLKPQWISLTWGSVLTTFLIAGILAWILPFFLGTFSQDSGYYKFLSLGFTVLFILLILYDTKILHIKAQKCLFSNSPPNYPKDSLGLLLDFLNLFTFMSK